MRILKGWTKEERKELEEAKDTESIGDFLHVITRYPEDTNYGYVRSNYHIASSREQFSIIEDILDFYTGKAKFPNKKYYVHFVKSDEDSYLNYGLADDAYFVSGKEQVLYTNKQFTKQEVEDINPKYLEFLEKVPVEELED